MHDTESLKADYLRAVAEAGDLAALEDVRVEALGRKGRITDLMKGLGQLPAEERRAAGQALNAVKDAVAGAIEARKQMLEEAALDAQLAGDTVDVSLPIRPESHGRLHPISQTIDEVIAIFGEMGFAVADGPDIEDDWYNFTALNIPPEHPARQMHDTFYLQTETKDDEAPRLLRTHTSNVQIRAMQKVKPPLRLITLGRTYRYDSDATHSPMFHQCEGLVVDETTHMGHLKGCLIEFCRAYFELDEVKTRFRPSFFPFTEPSAELDIGCSREGGELKLGVGDDWMEILGCGMVHPNVLRNCGVDPDRYQGFAFGMGVERIAMLKYGIPDIRSFYESDLRWLRHYGFVPLESPSLVRGLAL
jgi:phenylalanyl-tRNA synthetase alpha chain